jgi:Na+/proline symporter
MAILSIEWLLFTFGLLPHLMNKVLTLEKEEDLRPFTLSAGITLFLLSCFSVFAGMAARVLAPHLDSADAAIPTYIEHAFSPTVVALMVTGILAAILSTTSSLYLGLSAIIGNDLYRTLFIPMLYGKRAGASSDQIDRNVVLVSRGALIVVGIVSLFMSLNRPDSLSLLTQFGISAIISGVIAPIALGYFWKYANKAGAVASTILGSGCYILLTTTGIQNNVFLALAVGSIVGFIAMIAGSLSAEAILGSKATPLSGKESS